MPNIRTDLLAESNPALVELLRAEIAGQGRITFARFMQQALAHPEHGYYTSGVARPGFDGDFLTAPETSPLFGHALARQIIECWERLERPAAFTVREAGAGVGTLAREVIAGVQRERPEMLATLRYEVSDVSSIRVQEAVANIATVGACVPVSSAGDEPIVGVLLANELLDALPVHRLVFEDGELHEIYVIWGQGWFADEVGPLSDARLAQPLADLPLSDGQRLEVSPAAWEWAIGLGRQIERGYAIVIDYGYPAAELYAPARMEGTLKSYSQHEVAVAPYRRVGRQDLTAHVDFTAVSRAAQAGGMTELGLTTQAYFFAGLGIEELLLDVQRTATDAQAYIAAREAVLHLLDPRGLGRFRVLVLGKSVPATPPLRGLAFTLR
jgi:SAM-dependent MidA family methyltransferase